jgi:serine protease
MELSNFTRPLRSVLSLICATVAIPALAAHDHEFPVEMVNGHEAVAHQVLIRLKAGVSMSAKAAIERDFDVDASKGVGDGRVFLMNSKGRTTASLVRDLSKRSELQYAEPNYVVHADVLPNDTFMSSLWGLNNYGQLVNGSTGIPGADIDAPLAWDISTGSRNNVVAVVDTGVNYNHPDLQANMWTAPAAFTVTIGGITRTCPAGARGFNAITNTFDPMDDNRHGSHCSGTIGGVGNNGYGVAGVNWTASIMGCKFLGSSGSGTTANAVNAIEFAIQARQVLGAAANVRVLSNSWGGGGFSQTLFDEITKANTNNMLFIAAAGNNATNTDTTIYYPQGYNVPNVISVAATSSTDGLASFSNYGATSVDLGAPGVNVLSTVLGTSFSYLNGTSMATPHVAGAAALVLSVNGSLSVAAVRSTLLNTTDPIASLAGRTVTGGRLNLFRAVSAVTPPAPDFTMGATPPTQSVVQGVSASYTVSVSSVNGFSGAVDLTINGLPAGASATLTPGTISGGAGSSILDVTTAGVAPGSYTLTVTGTSGTTVRSTSVVLTVTAPPAADFSISASPRSQTVRHGEVAEFKVSITAINGFAEVVNLSVTGLAGGTTATWLPTASVNGSGIATLRIETTGATSKGDMTLTIAGASATRTHSTTVQVMVHR